MLSLHVIECGMQATVARRQHPLPLGHMGGDTMADDKTTANLKKQGVPRETLEVYFATHIGPKQRNGCIPWTGRINSGTGYGQLKVKRQTLTSYRLAWWLARGSVDMGLVIDHVCQNKLCVNVEHLRLVTPRENAVENSTSIAAINSAKKTCKRGHLLVVNGKRGHRNCQPCTLMWHRQLRRLQCQCHNKPCRHAEFNGLGL